VDINEARDDADSMANHLHFTQRITMLTTRHTSLHTILMPIQQRQPFMQ